MAPSPATATQFTPNERNVLMLTGVAHTATHYADLTYPTLLAFVLGIVGQYCGGLVADRHDLRWSYFVFHLASLPVLLLMATAASLPLLALAGIFTFFSLGMQPIENSLFAALTPGRWRSTGYGVKFIFTFGVGSVAVWLVAWIEPACGLSRVYLALAAVVSALLVVIAIFARSAPRHLRRDEL